MWTSMEVDPIPDHKLCGFVCSVVGVKKNDSPMEFPCPCHLLGEGSELGFETENGVRLNLIQPNQSNSVLESPKKRRRIGVVRGSTSVIHQLHALLIHKCIKLKATLIRVSYGSLSENERGLVLIDVYLPIALWSGWQFPRSPSTAAALFTHLRCEWGLRSSLLLRDVDAYGDDASIWNVCDCHILGCKLHGTPDSSGKNQFELHEIFKSLPSFAKEGIAAADSSSRINPVDSSWRCGIWELSDDILLNILSGLNPMDLVRVSATCHHLRSVAASIMPCMRLKLFPHQQAAVEWMLKRERNADVLPHPLFMDFLTEDGFAFYVNAVTGEIVTGAAPTIRDNCGGMFCDEPGLGKTITALSLILKTQGTLADPPDGVQIIWCKHNNHNNADQRYGYYELSGDSISSSSGNITLTSAKTPGSHNSRRGRLSLGDFTSMDKLICSPEKRAKPTASDSASVSRSAKRPVPVRCTRSLSRIKRNLLYTYEGISGFSKGSMCVSPGLADHSDDETWVQCDACHKWRRLADTSIADATAVWFCSMNVDLLHQSCSSAEESWDHRQSITYLPGFHTRGTTGGKEQNVSFFTNVLKEHYASINSETKKALNWLAKLSPGKLAEMETVGLIRPRVLSNGDSRGFHKIFQAFGLVKRVEKGAIRWYYPRTLDNLVFDLAALRTALCEPLDSFRFYLSRATLVVVPTNLVDHWMNQIRKHVRPGQLRLYTWTDHKRPPSVHNLAWDYDVVITTFSRLSAEWGPRKRSVLMQVHWLRLMLDEGHTLGSSLNMTNKLQMAVSLKASNRWLLTGTPTPNTPNSQLSHLQPMLKFLHEEAYGQNHKSWEAGILRPFEAEMEEGRSRLLQLLHRCMISARKIDLQTIPPCIKKVKYLNFTEEHARTYNELVVTVRRNILMADWNDPSHVESLLNPKQWKFRSTTIRNVRLSCCVAGHIKVTDAGQDIQETMDILVENGLDPASEEYAFIKYNILYGGNCLRCEEWCRLPVITPCRHLLCLDCVGLDSEKCTFPGCGNLYEMQSPEILTRPENPNPKWPVPKDLIELQPSYKQDNWDPDWQSTSSSKVTYLVQKLKELQEINRKIGHSMDEAEAEAEAEAGGDANHIHHPCHKNHWNHEEVHSGPCKETKIPSPEKVLIFSQFLEHIHVIEQQLTVAGISFARMYSPMHSSNKMKSLATFQHDPSCMALLMDGTAALGLDLSFVTHVFLMEPIWDRSMEEQVISRAHRMGATRAVNVETLAMRGTIEAQMLEFLQDADECRRFLKEVGKSESEGSGSGSGSGSRSNRTFHDFAESNYLSHLTFVTKIST